MCSRNHFRVFYLWKQAAMCVCAFHANVFSFAKPLLDRHVLVPGLRPQSILRALRAFHLTDSGPMPFVPCTTAEATPAHPPTPLHLKRQRSENPRNHDASTRGPSRSRSCMFGLHPHAARDFQSQATVTRSLILRTPGHSGG